MGLALGSFTNAYVWRIRMQAETKSKKKLKQLSILKGRSMCPDCEHTLTGKDLLPLVSWLSLRGRCRYCDKPISIQYPLVELLTGVQFVVFYLLWPLPLTGTEFILFAVWLIIAVLLNSLVIYDLKWMELPNRMVAPLTSLSVVFILLSAYLSGSNPGTLIGPLTGGLMLFVLFYFLFQASAGRWIGGGDVKLAFALGLLAGGFLEAVLLLFIASLLGTFIGIPQMLAARSKRNIKLPFGPLLVLATYAIFFYGEYLVDLYLRFSGLA